tara:strand:+ start:3339 stop:4070 length:732 start_codon:yes stop_codon:yes gene_type:complete
MINDLEKIARETETDKWQHEYTNYYSLWFEPIRYDELKILEIGVYTGASIRMWERYFPNSKIYGVDNGTICSKETMNKLKSDRVITEYIDQSSRESLQEFIDTHGGEFDIILDDGFHYQEHQQVSWGFLFPHLKKGGLYIIEDIILPRKRYRGEGIPEFLPEGEDGKWGIQDTDNFTDLTLNVLIDLVANNKLHSPYMTENEIKYIEDNIGSHDNLSIRMITKGSASFAAIKKSGDGTFNHIS